MVPGERKMLHFRLRLPRLLLKTFELSIIGKCMPSLEIALHGATYESISLHTTMPIIIYIQFFYEIHRFTIEALGSTKKNMGPIALRYSQIQCSL